MRLALPAALCGRCASLCLPRRKVAGRPKRQASRRKRVGHEEHARAGGLAGGLVRRRDSVGPVCLTTRSQCALVVPVLWTALVRSGLVRHPSPEGCDSDRGDNVLPNEPGRLRTDLRATDKHVQQVGPRRRQIASLDP